MSEYKKRHEDDWSGRHVRIRFEMILSASVFFILARYGAEEIRLPLIGLKSEINDDLLLYASFGFCLFAIVALLVRSHYEKMRWPKEEVASIKEINILYVDFESICEMAEKIEFNSDDAPDETFRKVQGFHNDLEGLNVQSNRFLGFLSDLSLENGMNSPVHPKFWGKVVSLMAAINSASNNLSKISRDVHQSQGTVLAMNSNQNTIHQKVTAYHSQLVDGIKAIKPEILERKKALKTLAFTKKFQREFLSYGLPIVTAILLLFFGIINKFCGFT